MREKPKQSTPEVSKYDVNFVVRSDGTVFPDEVLVDKVKNVTFHPEGPRHVITVKFLDRVPFKDWECSVKTADLGETLSGKMRRHAQNDYKFRVFSHQVGDEE